MLRVGEPHERVRRVVLIEARVEDPRDPEPLIAWNETYRRQFTLRAGDEDGVADPGTQGEGQFVAQDDGWGNRLGVGGGVEVGVGALVDGLEEVAYAELVVGEDALDEGAARAGAAGDEDLAVEAGSSGDDVRLGGEALEEWTPVPDAVACGAHELHVGEGTDEALL